MFLASRILVISLGSEDIDRVYEAAKYFHLCAVVRTLKPSEKEILRNIAEASTSSTDLTTKTMFAKIKTQLAVSFTVFHEHVRKFDEMRLLNSEDLPGKGRKKEIVLRYDPEKVKEVCGG